MNESGEGIQNSVALADSILSRSSYASYSASAILMMVFQFVTDNSAIQRKVTECLMALKDDLVKVINHVWFASLFNIKYDELIFTNKWVAIYLYLSILKDMLCVIAHGTPNARLPAANLLFYYWPSLNPTPVDRRNILSKFNTSPTWTPPMCCSPDCQVSKVFE